MKPLQTALAAIWLVIILSVILSMSNGRRQPNFVPPMPPGVQQASPPKPRNTPPRIPQARTVAPPSVSPPSLDEALKGLKELSRPVEPPAPREYRSPEESIVLSEVMYHPPGGDHRDEWIEIGNRGTKPVDLDGWKFVEGIEYEFPKGTAIAPGGYLVVCADAPRARAASGIENALGNWSGRLDRGGETIRLASASGKDVFALRYGDQPPFPALADGLGSSLELRDPHGEIASPANWGASAPSGWVRFRAEGEATLNDLYIYLLDRGIVLIDDVSIREIGAGGKAEAERALGPEIARNGGFEGRSGSWSFNGNHGSSRILAGPARSGKGCLAVISSDAGSTRTSAVVAPDLGIRVGSRYAVEFWALFLEPKAPVVFRLSNSKRGQGIHVESRPQAGSTPGRSNSLSTSSTPPFIHPVTQDARVPEGRPAVIRARLTSSSPLREVLLHYQVHGGKGGEEKIALACDDRGDRPTQGIAGGNWSTPLGPFSEGTLVTYHLTAVDADGRSARAPFAGNPTATFGFISGKGEETDPIPTYSLFMEPAAAAALLGNSGSDAEQPAVFACGGRVYPDVRVRCRGQTSRYYPKRSLKVKFNRDDPFEVPGMAGKHPVRSIDLNASYADKSYLREVLGFGLLRDLGEAASLAFPVRVHLNGELHGLFVHIEDPGEAFLKRNDLDEGWLWKSYSNGSPGHGYFELEAGDPETAAPLLAEFIEKMSSLKGSALEAYIRDRIDVESFTRYLVACQLMHQGDHIEKNYLLHADRDGRFRMLGWDLDLTHGRNFECRGGGLLSDFLRHDLWDEESGNRELLYGTRQNPKCEGRPNAIMNAFLGRTTAFRGTYYSRIAEALAGLYHPDVLIPKIRRLEALIAEDALRDRRKWGTWGDSSPPAQHQKLLEDWVRRRFGYLRGRLGALGFPVGEPLGADFSLAAASGPAPFSVTFRNFSAGKAEAFEWDFGDGAKSTEEEPTHVYEKPGCRTVTLKAIGPGGRAHAVTRRDAVHVWKPAKVLEAPAVAEGRGAAMRTVEAPPAPTGAGTPTPPPAGEPPVAPEPPSPPAEAPPASPGPALPGPTEI